MKQEFGTRNCKNCNQKFTIEPDDFGFYEKINVPAPTWCPECRIQRRLAFRNERSLYKNKCGLCGKNTLSIHSPGGPFVDYCVGCWYSDAWDPMEYGRDYDFSRPFFEQYHELYKAVPQQALYHKFSTDSSFANFLEGAKNTYLSYSALYSENVFYSKNIDACFWIADSFDLVNSRQCFGSISSQNLFNCKFAYFSKECVDSSFVYDCINCTNCFLCTNLRGKKYCFKNRQLSKDEYEKEVAAYATGSLNNLQRILGEFENIVKGSLHKYGRIVNCINSTGDDLRNSKNSENSFSAYDLENVKYAFRSLKLKDSMDVINAGSGMELAYEFINGGGNNSRLVRFCSYGIEALNDVYYVDSCASAGSLFGCVGLRNKEYCILNKQYSKEEYEKMIPSIIAHMNDMPYVDKKGRTYKYGEFFPPELSPFAYNETIAQEYFPLTKEEAIGRGYRWRDPDTKGYKITKTSEDLPDHIEDADDGILKEIIGCAHNQTCNEQCTAAFKIIPDELQFYRKMNLPLPRLCPNCRHYQRLKKRNPLKLWHRKCQCAGVGSENGIYQNSITHQHGEVRCPNEFETPYAPDRSEIVYCETCYNSEVA